MKKNLFKIFFLLIIIFILTSCSSLKKYDISRERESDWVKIAYNSGKDEIEYIAIDDKEILIKLDSFRNSEIRKPSKSELLDGICEKWVIYDDGTIIGLYAESDYGNIGEEIETVGKEAVLPSGMSEYVSLLIEKFKS